ncbi:MAG: methylmalonyl-CoA mutase subunit beta [Candidatus Cloacimonetes bacterium]|nr:methylmalonyl-CoA mutase subunit beta [Candidatus Cloacimonadota bacterium]
MADQEKTDFVQDLHLSDIFPAPTYEDWKKEAEVLLKGAPFDKIMKTNTVEGIILEAIYNADDIKDIDYLKAKPGEFPYVRGTSFAQKQVSGWDIQQELDVKSLNEWNAVTLKDLQKGQNSLRIKLNSALSQRKSLEETKVEELFNSGLPIYSYDNLKTVLKDISLKHITVDFEAGCSVLPFFGMVKKYLTDNSLNLSDLNGSIAGDLVKVLVETGKLNCSLKHLLDELALLTKTVIKENAPLKTILIDLSVYNNAGSSAVEDLAIMCSTVVFYVDELSQRGLSVDEIFSKMTFIFGVGTNLFMEISKLRAARYLFAKLAESYNAKSENAKMRMHIRTSEYTKTVFDPWVNILRTSTEAFSAVLGGCDSLNVSTFDFLNKESDEFSRRIARNQQIILLEEAHLNAVNDPAGGSYYVEALTNQLIEKSWDFFVEIEDKGGILEDLKAGSIQDRINQSHQYRTTQAEIRKDVLVGTSMYVNLDEKKLEDNISKTMEKFNSIGKFGEEIKLSMEELINSFNNKTIDVISENLCQQKEDGLQIVSIPKRRLAESYEFLRQTSEKYKQANGYRPKAFFANIGNVVKNKPRYDFSVGFFEPAGFDCITNDSFETVDDVLKAINDEKVIVLCSSDDMYPTIVPDFAKKLKDKFPDKVLVLAGYPKEHISTFTEAGVDFFIYMKANVIQTITQIMKKTGVL